MLLLCIPTECVRCKTTEAVARRANGVSYPSLILPPWLAKGAREPLRVLSVVHETWRLDSGSAETQLDYLPGGLILPHALPCTSTKRVQ